MIPHAERDSLVIPPSTFFLMRTSKKTLAAALATAFVAGSFEVDDLVERGYGVIGKQPRWMQPLAERLHAAFPWDMRPRRASVERFLLFDYGFHRAYRRSKLTVASRIGSSPVMNQGVVASGWKAIRPLTTPAELADWLNVPLRQLDWFAGVGPYKRAAIETKLQHYRYRVLKKVDGNVRLLEAPKARLKRMQQKILTEILNHIPPHATCHGFRRGRSIATFAKPHQGQAVVVKLDLRDFFPSIRAAQIHALFLYLGYPEPVAYLLTGLCMTSAPETVWRDIGACPRNNLMQEQIRRYARPHLPQGAPTSPALANLCAYRLDYRLSGLALAAGANYTRYADDLAFSGDAVFRRAAQRFVVHATAIVLEEGYQVHHRKTRVMRQSVRQKIAGLVVNQQANVPREDFDRLKATLTNCVRHGPESQNRADHANFRLHLRGRIAFVESINRKRGEQLRSIFAQITWPQSA